MTGPVVEKLNQQFSEETKKSFYVDCGQIDFAENYTIEAWFVSSKKDGSILSAYTKDDKGVREHGIYLAVHAHTGLARYVHRMPLGTSGGREDIYSTNVPVSDGELHYLAAIMSDTEMVMYLDGVAFRPKRPMKPHNPQKMSKTLHVILGQLTDVHLGRPFIGQINKLQIWNRAKTQEEISAAWHARLGTDLLAHYPIEGANGLKDSTNNDNVDLTDHDGGSWAHDIKNFDRNNFSISVRFKVTTLRKMDLVTLSHNHRAVQINLKANGNMEYKYNNSNFVTNPQQYTANTWHTATVTYDGTSGKFYLDGVLGGEDSFAIEQGGTKNVGYFKTGGASGAERKDLRIYQGIQVD